ncbi:fibrillarin-like rRNA/tRNA 2'-O-methyltransferase [Archaeoglobus veneficus]|uniref:Fibrillarin-like rRNA/tRNA 2'-O-methyltransferase n=1 Tax=Archaeoglobus veneficus (strain DSM 11195 / SNP6) TaxID=693661 RepID=F2KN19_ARCVS|nr:fibrillarin-like rRNA/tRNA 2'-O-methyltransferase [Archaeoglobus veneficus]AEA47295.1 Fibrillarin-like rRNA/tRNA 2'-O-methyltransferase [Archaeoglobus veneficus SNP6]
MKGKTKEILHNVYLIEREDRKILATKSKYGTHYGEKKFGEFREWIPSRSKLAAMLLKGYSIDIKPDWKILYLGAASGTTVSHLADIVEEGVIYAVEYSAKPFTKLIELAEERRNIIPLLEDASKPQRYSGIVEKVDFVYQDIAQKNQVEIFLDNIGMFLKEGGEGLIMVKARSIDSTAEPSEIFRAVIKKLSESLRVVAHEGLEPYHKDHIFVHVSV